MLYDKRWDKPEVKADPLTMDSLIAWLEQMPAEKRYNYNNCDGKCLYGLYMASHGVEWEESGSTSGYGDRSDFCLYVYSRVAASGPWTFGAALHRARRASPFVSLSPQENASE